MAAPTAPGTPVVVFADGASGNLTVNFTYTTATDPTLYFVQWNTVPTPSNPSTEFVPAVDIGNNQKQGKIVLIGTGIQYYIWAAAVANGITTVSAPLLFNALPSNIPSTPFLVADDRTNSTLTLNFFANPPPGEQSTYQVIMAYDNDPNGRVNTGVPATLVQAPNLWGTLPFNVPRNYTWYFFSRVIVNGDLNNVVYSTPPLIYNSASTGFPPSGPTSSPAGVSATNTQLVVSFNSIGVTGTTPFQVSCQASTSPAGPFNVTTVVRTVSPNNYLATTIGDLPPNTTYYFRTQISNGILPNQISVVSGPFATTNTSQVSPPEAIDIQATQVTLQFNLPFTAFNPAQTTGYIRWGTVNTNLSPLANQAVATYLGIDEDGDPLFEGTVYNLNPGTQYYFQGQYIPVGVSATTAVPTLAGNSFDLGYMPPRPWATPNPVIVRGVSQPWRQT